MPDTQLENQIQAVNDTLAAAFAQYADRPVAPQAAPVNTGAVVDAFQAFGTPVAPAPNMILPGGGLVQPRNIIPTTDVVDAFQAFGAPADEPVEAEPEAIFFTDDGPVFPSLGTVEELLVDFDVDPRYDDTELSGEILTEYEELIIHVISILYAMFAEYSAGGENHTSDLNVVRERLDELENTILASAVARREPSKFRQFGE